MATTPQVIRKYLVNATTTFQNTIRINCDSWIIDTSVGRDSLVTYTDAARHYAKPRGILFPTYLRYVSVQTDGNMAPMGPMTSQWTFYCRGGQHSFVHHAHNFKSSMQFSSAGRSESVAQLGAGSAFTGQMGQFGETLATLNETGSMIMKRGKQIGDIVRALRRGDFKRLESMIKGEVPGKVRRLPPAKRVADGWLELQFGWMPLVEDVYSAVEAYRNRLEKGMFVKGRRVNSTAGGFKSLDSSKTSDNAAYSNYGSHTAYERILQNGANASARQYGTVSNPTVATLNQLGLANPALIAWQLMPFSFVVDWFAPISSILGYMSNGWGMSIHRAVSTIEHGNINVWQCGMIGPSSRYVVRTPTFPSVLPPVGLPTRGLGLWHAATGSALVAQSFGRR